MSAPYNARAKSLAVTRLSRVSQSLPGFVFWKIPKLRMGAPGLPLCTTHVNVSSECCGTYSGS